ncbi:hypothetical protein ACNS7O_17980 (plasmid) [Haloferacaceae archaeon DSL9]
MSTTNDALAAILRGRATIAVFGLLTIPLALGAIDARLMTPLALPGYLLKMVMTIIGSYLAPQYAFWLYWIPFFAVSYGIAVIVGAGYYLLARTD